MKNIKTRKFCSLCKSKNLKTIFYFGNTPLANNLIKKKVIQKKYPLTVQFCQSCKHTQLKNIINPKILFSKYLYMSSVSKDLKDHFSKYALDIKKIIKKKDEKVLDIGSNDGFFLEALKKFKINSYGVEPAKNLYNMSKKKKLKIFNNFFDKKFSDLIKSKNLYFKVITANTVFAHIDNLDEVVDNISRILDKNGTFIFEVSYLRSIIENNIFDTFYHEHLNYHSIEPLIKFFRQKKMFLYDAKKITTHGGSIRVFVSNNEKKITVRLKKIISYEKENKLNSLNNLKSFFKRVNRLKKSIKNFLKKKVKDKSLIIGYGAPAKLITFLSFCNISKKTIHYIIEDNRLKIGRFIPNLMIPVVSKKRFLKNKVFFGCCIIFAWNVYKKIIKQNKKIFNKNNTYVLIPQITKVY